MRLLLILPTTEGSHKPSEIEARQRVYSAYMGPHSRFDFGYIERGSTNVDISQADDQGEREFEDVAPYIAARAAQAETEGFDACIIHCTPDPGLEEARRLARIPVIGPGETSYPVAVSLGKRVGIVVPYSKHIPRATRLAKKYGPEGTLSGVRGVDISIPAIQDDLVPEMRRRWLDTARQLVVDGADVILPWGFAYVPVHLAAQDLSAELGVPVVDPGFLAVRHAEFLVDAGLTHSPRAYGTAAQVAAARR